MASVTLTEGKMIPFLTVSFPLADWVLGRGGPALYSEYETTVKVKVSHEKGVVLVCCV